MIRKIDEVDPLPCLRCGAAMKAIAAIEDEEVSYRIRSPLWTCCPQGMAHGPHPSTPASGS